MYQLELKMRLADNHYKEHWGDKMKKDELLKIISIGEQSTFTVDPDIKTEISRKQIDAMVRDMKKHLAKNKRVHIILVKE